MEVYQRSMDLLVPLHELVLEFPDYERFELASQLRRASKSIPAKIAEGYGKKPSAREFKNYISHALGSANEVIVHLRIAERLGHAKAEQAGDLVAGHTVLAKQLYRLMEAWQSSDKPSPKTIPPLASRVSHQDRNGRSTK